MMFSWKINSISIKANDLYANSCGCYLQRERERKRESVDSNIYYRIKIITLTNSQFAVRRIIGSQGVLRVFGGGRRLHQELRRQSEKLVHSAWKNDNEMKMKRRTDRQTDS